MQLTARHLNLVLASLRHFQGQLPAITAAIECFFPECKDVPSSQEIDTLCEDLNCGAGVSPASQSSLRNLHDKLSALLEDPARDLYAETIFTLAADYLAANAASLADPPACHAPTGECEDPQDKERHAAILELAREQCGDAEIDEDAIISEGNDNGCYVAAWVWCGFEGTPFDKDTPDEDEATA